MTPPPTYAGLVTPGFEPLAQQFSRAIHRGGGALVLRRGDRTLVDICVGWADRNHTRPWTPSTVSLGFSVAKGLASTVVHRLVDRGLLDYDSPISDFWPEFARAGKSVITLRHVLTHRAGLWDMRPLIQAPEDWLDHELMEARLADTPLTSSFGIPGYHALTYGWLIAGIARRLTGKGIRQLVQEEIVDTLGIDGLYIGHAPDPIPTAELIGTMVSISRLHVRTQRLWSLSPYVPGFLSALYAPGLERHIYSGRILDTEMASSNGTVSARGLAALYAALANEGVLGGHTLLTASRTRQLRVVQTRRRDRVIAGMKMLWRLGYHQANGVPATSHGAFGHEGIGGPTGWADQDTGLSFGLVWNDIGNHALGASRALLSAKISRLAWTLAAAQ